MKVTIPTIDEHAGYPCNLGTFKIADVCPICGGPRGHLFPAISYDGSRRLHCDGWRNPCGHTDKYAAVRQEGVRVDFKEPENTNQ